MVVLFFPFWGTVVAISLAPCSASMGASMGGFLVVLFFPFWGTVEDTSFSPAVPSSHWPASRNFCIVRSSSLARDSMRLTILSAYWLYSAVSSLVLRAFSCSRFMSFSGSFIQMPIAMQRWLRFAKVSRRFLASLPSSLSMLSCLLGQLFCELPQTAIVQQGVVD